LRFDDDGGHGGRVRGRNSGLVEGKGGLVLRVEVDVKGWRCEIVIELQGRWCERLKLLMLLSVTCYRVMLVWKLGFLVGIGKIAA
jgi:hypothetical protein